MASNAKHQMPQGGSRLPPSLPYVAAGVILLTHALLAWALRTPALLTSQDDTAYYLLARALRGLHYGDLWLVGQPLEIRYPPGYPLLLAVWGLLSRGSYGAYLALNIGASTAALGIVFLALARMWTPTFALLGLVATAFSPWLVAVPGELRPEAAFALFTVIALVLASSGDRRARTALLAGACAVYAALLRLPGLAVIAALGLDWLLARRYRQAAILGLVAAATAGLWLVWTLYAPDQFIGSSYGADFAAPVVPDATSVAQYAVRIWDNALRYVTRIIPALLVLPAVSGSVLDNLLTAGLTLVGMLVGCGVLLVRWRAAGLFLLAYAGILSIWTWQSGRYLYPVLPLLVPTVLIGVGWLARRAHPRAAMPVVAVLALIMAVGGLLDTFGLVRRAARCERGGSMPSDSCLGPEQRQYFAALRFLADSTAGDAVVHASKPEPIFLYTGRLTVGRAAMLSALEADSAATLAPLREAGVTHVLLAHLAASDRRIFRQMERRCSALGLRAAFGPETYLFSVPAPGEEPAAGACAALDSYGRSTFDPETGRVRVFPASWPPPARE